MRGERFVPPRAPPPQQEGVHAYMLRCACMSRSESRGLLHIAFRSLRYSRSYALSRPWARGVQSLQ
eukprot:8745431-Ditylum_brightwellii.AAC.1